MRRRTGMVIYVRRFKNVFGAYLNDPHGYSSDGISASKAIDHLMLEADQLVDVLGMDFLLPDIPIIL